MDNYGVRGNPKTPARVRRSSGAFLLVMLLIYTMIGLGVVLWLMELNNNG